MILAAESMQDKKIKKEYYVYDEITGSNPTCVFYSKILNDNLYTSTYDADRNRFDFMYRNGYLYELCACYLLDKEKPTTVITVIGTDGVVYSGGIFGSESSDIDLIENDESGQLLRTIDKVRFLKTGGEE